jgi:hypothetical protein
MENDAATNNPERKTFARFLPPTARILLSLILLLFGLNGFLQFMPAPKDMPQDILNVSSALMKAGYLQVVSGTMVLVGVLLLVNRFVPLALAFLAPLIVGILTFHITMAPSSIGPGIVVAVLELYLAWAYRDAFRAMLRARVSHAVK